MLLGNRILFVLALLIGLVLLQIFLSKRESKWPGLVLPIIAFLWGLLYPLNMAALDNGNTSSLIFELIVVWLIGNIPTIILFAIYFGCRGKQRRNRQIDKMNIQDLG